MKYPVFVTEQVLTAKNLNDVVEFLNGQNLSTRRDLIGIGIVCGLEISSDEKTFVKINCGCGVTSLGLLINIPLQDLHYYRMYTDLASKPYARFIKADKTQYDLWELLTQKEYDEADDPSNNHKIEGNSNFDLKEMAVLLYLELIDKDLDNCIDEGCDEKGIARLFNLRKLLIKRSDLLKIIRTDAEGSSSIANRLPGEAELFKNFYPACDLPAIMPHRLNYNLSDLTGLNLANINTWQKLKNSFLGIVKADVVKIANALFKSYNLYKNELISLYPSGNPFPGFENTSVESNQLYHIIESEINENDVNIQYAYDFLCDLVKAYEEFLDVTVIYRSKCCIDTEQFPYHLMLGLLVNTDKKSEKIYRHLWQPSPAVSNMNDLLDRLRFLHYKIFQLITNFNLRTFQKPDNIIITPGKFSGWPFSKHSIAHYYSNGTSGIIHKYWNNDLVKKCREDTVLSCFPALYSSIPFVLQPLLYSLRDYEYFRIEGHIGQEYKSVMTKLRQLIKDYNLPFDLFGIKLSADHLDIEVEDHCFSDIQTSYKCNRDEYLACVKSLSTLINAFIKAIIALKKIYPNILNYNLTQGNPQLGFISTLQQLFVILQIFAYYLNKIQQQLPEHIKDFKYDEFRVSYFVVFAFSLFYQIYLEFLSNLMKEFSAPFLQVMLLKTMFERLLDDCMDSKFKSLYDMYRERLVKMQLGRLFPGYVTGSPGMEHIAGVKEGGTFILVYDIMPSVQPEVEEEPEKPEEEDICFEEDEAKELQLTVLQYAHVIMKEPVLIDELKDQIGSAAVLGDIYFKADANTRAKRDVTTDTGTGEAKESEFRESSYTHNRVKELQKQYPTRKEFLGYLFGKAEEVRQVKRQYRVVADFSVPFRCCSSCLQIDELPSPNLSISIEPSAFCRKDTRKYPVIGTPEGGQLVSSAGGLIQETSSGVTHHYFVPANTTGAEEIVISYTLEGETIKTVIYVYNPIANFEKRIITTGGAAMVLTHVSMEVRIEAIAFINTSENADRYEWRIPEMEYVSSEKDISFPIDKLPDSIEVRLTAFRDKCDNVKSERVQIREEQQVVFDLEKPKGRDDYIYCNNDSKEYAFTAIPEGNDLEGQNVIKHEDGGFYFKPLDLSEGEYEYKYLGKELRAKVLEVQKIKFNYKAEHYDEKDRILTVLFKFIGEITAEVIWNFRDGTQTQYSSNPTLIKEFNLSNQTKFNVSIDMHNENGCLSSFQKELDFSRYSTGLGGTGVGFINIDNYGALRLKDISDDPNRNRLEEYNYNADNDLLRYHKTLENNNVSDERKREAFLNGSLNASIAKKYNSALEETKNTIIKSQEKEDEEMTGYLSKIYLGELQQLIATIGTLSKDPSKNSTLYKALANSEIHLKELKDLSININPDDSLKELVEKASEKLENKKNTNEIVTKLSKLV